VQALERSRQGPTLTDNPLCFRALEAVSLATFRPSVL
jgi:hypothetical protein